MTRSGLCWCTPQPRTRTENQHKQHRSAISVCNTQSGLRVLLHIGEHIDGQPELVRASAVKTVCGWRSYMRACSHCESAHRGNGRKPSKNLLHSAVISNIQGCDSCDKAQQNWMSRYALDCITMCAMLGDSLLVVFFTPHILKRALLTSATFVQALNSPQ